MKITLTHDDVLCAVRDFLVQQGFSVPASNTDSFGVFWNEEGAQVTVEVSDITIAPLQQAPVQVSSTAPSRAPRTQGRFDPVPSPPREKLDTPNRILGQEGEPLPERVNNEVAIKGMVSQSQDILRRIPDPARAPHQAARDRFPKVQVADSIEDFGKDADDYKDEI
jgi:hypothetical protein